MSRGCTPSQHGPGGVKRRRGGNNKPSSKTSRVGQSSRRGAGASSARASFKAVTKDVPCRHSKVFNRQPKADPEPSPAQQQRKATTATTREVVVFEDRRKGRLVWFTRSYHGSDDVILTKVWRDAKIYACDNALVQFNDSERVVALRDCKPAFVVRRERGARRKVQQWVKTRKSGRARAAWMKTTGYGSS